MKTTITWYTMFVSVWIITGIIGHEREGFWKFFFWLLTAGALFWVGWKVTDGNGLVSVILAAVYLVWIIAAEPIKHKRQEKRNQARLKEEKRKEDAKKQAALARQKELEDKYADSPLTRKIIEAISDGTGRLPEEITIYNNHVTGRTNGQMRTFDFATNRVPFFKPSCFIPTNTDYHLLFGSKVALGNAINRILHEQYEVHDDHRHDADHRYNDNHEWVPVTRYTSNHVLLRLKATNYW